MGLGIYLPPTIGMTLVLGALLGWLIQRAIRRYGERNGKDWVAAAQERGLLLASGMIVGESLMGLALAAVIGDAPVARTEVVKKVWDYVKANNLQDPKDKRVIVADAKLLPVFGKERVGMFEITGLVGKHLLSNA